MASHTYFKKAAKNRQLSDGKGGYLYHPREDFEVCDRCGCSRQMIEHMGWKDCEGGKDD